METLAIYLDLQKAIKVVTLHVVKYIWPSQQNSYPWTAHLVSLQSTPATSRGTIGQSVSFLCSKRRESQSPPIFFTLTYLHTSQLRASGACITPALVLTRPAQPLIEVISQKPNLPKLAPSQDTALSLAALVNWTESQVLEVAQGRNRTTYKENHFSTTSKLFHELRYSSLQVSLVYHNKLNEHWSSSRSDSLVDPASLPVGRPGE